MKEIDPDGPGEYAELIKSKFLKTPEQKVGFQTFSYQRPAIGERKTRAAVRLALTDLVFAMIQVLEKGGESVMHSHAAMDGLWFVLRGRARFYDGDNQPHEFGPFEGVCIPRDTKYWFEQVGDEALEILQCEARHPNIKNTVQFDKPPVEGTPNAASRIAHFDAGTH